LKERNTKKIEIFNIENFIKGWVIGNFYPTLYSTNDVEVAVKTYKKGEFEDSHFHKIATEFTIIISGEVEMNGIRYHEGDIIKIEPEISTNFVSITDSKTVVIKLPGANNDKYIG
jgi:quercetin dioxygenase-like cupin family protein